MATTTRSQSRYDHRLRDLVRTTQDITCALHRGVPRSTARGWLARPAARVVTIDVLSRDTMQLQQEVLRLRTRIQKLIALLRVLLVVLKISRFSFGQTRLPDGHDKRSLLRVIDRSRSVLPLRSVLRIIRLSPSRYHRWSCPQQCPLEDRPSCPRLSPHQLTPAEVKEIRDLTTSPEYRHVPTRTLALLAQHRGKVFASATTWYRLIRDHQWRRPRQRIHPAKPKIGIRASLPNELWHIDTTLIRLQHQWLYLNMLDTVSAVERLVRFYIQEHNTRLPHSAFQGQTPDEMYFQTGVKIPERLEAARNEARRARAEANRNRECETCELVARRS